MGVLAHVVPKTPPRKMCQKPHQEKMRQNHHPEKYRFDWKSQGQIPRSNPKVKYFRNAKVKFPKVKWETTKKPEKTGFNRIK